MPQLRVQMLQLKRGHVLQLKILHAAIKTQCSQISTNKENTDLKKRERVCLLPPEIEIWPYDLLKLVGH